MPDRREREKFLIYGGLGLVGLGSVLWLSQAAPPPKPAPPPAPPPSPPPPAPPPPTPSPPRILGTQVVCPYPSWCGTLSGIAQRWYGDWSQWPKIYNANAALIEAVARAHGYQTSGDGGHALGWWIWSGTTLTIPA